MLLYLISHYTKPTRYVWIVEYKKTVVASNNAHYIGQEIFSALIGLASVLKLYDKEYDDNTYPDEEKWKLKTKKIDEKKLKKEITKILKHRKPIQFFFIKNNAHLFN